MDALIVTASAWQKIQQLNNRQRQLQPVQDSQGQLVLSADLLSDCTEGQTWAAYGSILLELDRRQVVL